MPSLHGCVHAYPKLQALYIFGSWGTEYEQSSSDVDIALLLPYQHKPEPLLLSPLHQKLERLLAKDVDLIPLRHVSTVLRKEIIAAERRVFCADTFAADTFEMLTISFYQKLNEERADILQDLFHTKRAYNV